MPLTPRRRWFQFSLRSLLGLVVVICLGLGGWHLLWTKGQYVEAEPAVVGQPIKIHRRFFHFGAADKTGGWRYKLTVYPNFESGPSMVATGQAKCVGWALKANLYPAHRKKLINMAVVAELPPKP